MRNKAFKQLGKKNTLRNIGRKKTTRMETPEDTKQSSPSNGLD